MSSVFEIKMLLNVSYNEPEVKEKIETAVGKPFSLRERWAMGGIGSSKLVVTTTSTDIHNLLILDNNQNTCNVELRPKGIILRFRSLLETYYRHEHTRVVSGRVASPGEVLVVVLVALVVAFFLIVSVVALPLLLLLPRKPPPGPPKPPPGPPKTKQNEKQNKTKRKTTLSSLPGLSLPWPSRPETEKAIASQRGKDSTC